jgi:hypothetical protein
MSSNAISTHTQHTYIANTQDMYIHGGGCHALEGGGGIQGVDSVTNKGIACVEGAVDVDRLGCKHLGKHNRAVYSHMLPRWLAYVSLWVDTHVVNSHIHVYMYICIHIIHV